MGPPGRRRWVRAAAAAAALVAATSACRLDVALTTRVGRAGSGVFSLRLAADRDLVDIARSAGEDPLAVLARVPEPLPAGWKLTTSMPLGGLAVTLERPFTSPGDLARGLADLERAAGARGAGTASLYSLRVERSSSFWRSRTSIAGTIDLTASGLLGASGLSGDAADQLRSFAAQAGGAYFRFVLRAELPGGVSSASGNPTEVGGGAVTWSPVLGRSLSFAASSTAYNRGGIAAIAVPVVALVALVLAARARVRRRRRRRSRTSGGSGSTG